MIQQDTAREKSSGGMRFRHLLERFCRVCSLDRPDRIANGGAVIVDGALFTLDHDERIDPDLAFIYCDFGEHPAGWKQAIILRTLLEANLSLGGGCGPAFARSRETGRIVYVHAHRMIGEGRPEALLDTLKTIAGKAAEWRTLQTPATRRSAATTGPVTAAPDRQAAQPKESRDFKLRFARLIDAFCTLAGSDVASHIADGGTIAVRDVAFRLMHEPQLDPARLYLRCDLGALPEQREAEACKALLEANLDLYDGAGAAFSIWPENGHALFSHGYRLDELGPETLAEILDELAGFVHGWRSDHLLAPVSRHSHQRRPIGMPRHLEQMTQP